MIQNSKECKTDDYKNDKREKDKHVKIYTALTVDTFMMKTSWNLYSGNMLLPTRDVIWGWGVCPPEFEI